MGRLIVVKVPLIVSKHSIVSIYYWNCYYNFLIITAHQSQIKELYYNCKPLLQPTLLFWRWWKTCWLPIIDMFLILPFFVTIRIIHFGHVPTTKTMLVVVFIPHLRSDVIFWSLIWLFLVTERNIFLNKPRWQLSWQFLHAAQTKSDPTSSSLTSSVSLSLSSSVSSSIVFFFTCAIPLSFFKSSLFNWIGATVLRIFHWKINWKTL